MANNGFSSKEQRNTAMKRYRSGTGKDSTKYTNYKSYCKTFILELATLEDIKKIKEWLKEREGS
ncbi:hypothetical protein [Fusobacterium periodonticum]|uniref:hypothetical protein n=1 Tax=Fusobacterium periodonticum TaxID=860 RepID=UPI0028D714F1|nr:hypothetical protein [Fusobacterium periodonticum]